MKQELDVLTVSVNAQQASEREEKIRCNDDIRNRTAATFIQSCWRRLLARKELQRLQKEAKELSIQLVGDSTTNHLEERGNDTIQTRSNSNFDVQSAPIQFYSNSHNSQFDHWIKLKFYVESPDMFSYLGLKYQVNRSLERHRNTGQHRLYEFCYLLPFDLWTSYLAMILFLKGCGSFFWESPNSTKIFNGLQHSFQVARIHNYFIILFLQEFLIHPCYKKERRLQNKFYIQIRFPSLFDDFLMVTNLILAYLGW
jgi:hypothetical protein